MLTPLEQKTLDWVQSLIDEPIISYNRTNRPARRTILFNITGTKAQLVLMIRLERDGSKPAPVKPRSKTELQNEIEAINICRGIGPELIDFNYDLGALLFKPLPGEARSLAHLLHGRHTGNDDRRIHRIYPTLKTLTGLHKRKIPPNSRVNKSGEEIYSYILDNARKINPKLTLPALKGNTVLIHGNPNPGNFWLHDNNVDSVGTWLDFEDSHLGIAEFDYGYLIGHLRVCYPPFNQDHPFNALKKWGIGVDRDKIVQIGKTTACYVLATENIYRRYPFIKNHKKLLEELK